jgi:hypothetical protein
MLVYAVCVPGSEISFPSFFPFIHYVDGYAKKWARYRKCCHSARNVFNDDLIQRCTRMRTAHGGYRSIIWEHDPTCLLQHGIRPHLTDVPDDSDLAVNNY